MNLDFTQLQSATFRALNTVLSALDERKGHKMGPNGCNVDPTEPFVELLGQSNALMAPIWAYFNADMDIDVSVRLEIFEATVVSIEQLRVFSNLPAELFDDQNTSLAAKKIQTAGKLKSAENDLRLYKNQIKNGKEGNAVDGFFKQNEVKRLTQALNNLQQASPTFVVRDSSAYAQCTVQALVEHSLKRCQMLEQATRPNVRFTKLDNLEVPVERGEDHREQHNPTQRGRHAL